MDAGARKIRDRPPGAGRRQPLPAFTADLVLGHFEQGGATQYAGARVVVEKVLYFRRLSAAPATSAAARYIQLGAGERRFLFKEIDSRPDFDHVLMASARPGVATGTLSVPRNGLGEPAPASFARALPGMESRGTVYFYTDDLR